MKITIGKDTYIVSKFTTRTAFKAAELTAKASATEGLIEENAVIEEVIRFIAEDLYGGQFTAERFMDEYESESITPDIYMMLNSVRGLITGKLAEFPPTPGAEGKNAPRGSKA